MGETSNNNKNNKSSARGKKKSSPSLGSRAGGGGGKGVASLVARGVMLFSRVAKGGVFHRQFVFRRLREGAGVARFLCCALLLSDFPPPDAAVDASAVASRAQGGDGSRRLDRALLLG